MLFRQRCSESIMFAAKIIIVLVVQGYVAQGIQGFGSGAHGGAPWNYQDGMGGGFDDQWWQQMVQDFVVIHQGQNPALDPLILENTMNDIAGPYLGWSWREWVDHHAQFSAEQWATTALQEGWNESGRHYGYGEWVRFFASMTPTSWAIWMWNWMRRRNNRIQEQPEQPDLE